MCVCVQARHCACLDVCKPVYLNECRSVLRLTARHEDKSKTRERELKTLESSSHTQRCIKARAGVSDDGMWKGQQQSTSPLCL